VLFRLSAALQQSMSPIMPIGHDCSLECIGTPAKALPVNVNNRINDMSLILMAAHYSRENFESLSTFSWATAIVTACFAAQPFNTLFDDNRNHDQSRNRIGPPPSKKRIEKQSCKENC
jgi:hypothetical protein